jgi:hypothetical protein
MTTVRQLLANIACDYQQGGAYRFGCIISSHRENVSISPVGTEGLMYSHEGLCFWLPVGDSEGKGR